MSATRLSTLIAAGALALLAGCGRAEVSGPVRTASEADDVARRALRAAHLDEEVVGADRQGGAWIVTTRWRENSFGGHLLTIDAANGKVVFERYRTLQIAEPPTP